jgi:hypothetical protein
MDKKNLLVIAGVLAAALLLLAATIILRPPSGVLEDTIIITVDGKEYARIPLSAPQTVTVDQGDGRVNVVEISDRGAVMHSSTCDNQSCVEQGWVTLENRESRVLGNLIICLPNEVVLEVLTPEEAGMEAK